MTTALVTVAPAGLHVVEVEGLADLAGDAAHAVQEDGARVGDDLAVALDLLDAA